MVKWRNSTFPTNRWVNNIHNEKGNGLKLPEIDQFVELRREEAELEILKNTRN